MSDIDQIEWKQKPLNRSKRLYAKLYGRTM